MTALSALAPSRLMNARGQRVAACFAILAISALLMVPAFDQPAAENDEGLLVAFPARLLHGELPHRDFYDPYGPGGVWVVAAADEAFGTSLGSERAVGMVY